MVKSKKKKVDYYFEPLVDRGHCDDSSMILITDSNFSNKRFDYKGGFFMDLTVPKPNVSLYFMSELEKR